MFSKTRVLFITLLVAFLALGGCQTPPPKGLTPAQVAVLKQQGFELTDEGWAFGLSGKVLVSTSGGGGELVSSGTIFGGAALIGLVNIVLLTAMATVGAAV